MSELFDVFAVNIATNAEREIATLKTEENADAIIMMAVARRGVGEEFYVKRPATGAPQVEANETGK